MAPEDNPGITIQSVDHPVKRAWYSTYQRRQYIDKEFKEVKEEPARAENWAEAVGFGLDELVKLFKGFTGSSIAAWSALGAASTGCVVGNVIDSDSAKKTALKKIGFTHDDNGIPWTEWRPGQPFSFPGRRPGWAAQPTDSATGVSAITSCRGALAVTSSPAARPASSIAPAAHQIATV